MAGEFSHRWGGAVRAHAAPNCGLALAHAGGLEQILENLLHNAAKYSPREKPIDIVTRRADGEVLISVHDRGIGIAAGDVDAMFQPFYRSEAAAARAAGMGLGLAVCQRLISAMSGRIWAERRSGGGTVVTLALPQATEDDDSAPQLAPPLAVSRA